MTVSLYMLSIQMCDLEKRLQAVGVKVYSFNVKPDGGYSADALEDVEYWHDAHVNIHTLGTSGPENEARAAEWLTRYGGELRRNSGGIYLFGHLPLGLRYRIYFGTGVCERVVTGQRWVDEKPAVPGHYEDIVEVVCA